MNVEFKGKVFYNQQGDKTYYNISDGSKNVDGVTWTNKSWSARFKGNVPQEESKIKGTGFFSYYQKEKGTPIYTTIQVMEWSYVDEKPNAPTTENNTELPF